MPSRAVIIEQIKREIYGGIPTDDYDISDNLISSWLDYGFALCAKQNFKDNIQIEGTGYINNSFYCTFSGLMIASDNSDNFQYALTLPQIPLAFDKNEGIATLQFKKNGETSQSAIPLSLNQVGYESDMRRIPNKILYYSEGQKIRIKSTLQLSSYTATVKMVSAGDSTDLNAVVNVPSDYLNVAIEYASKMLLLERSQPRDQSNDDSDNNLKNP